MRKAFVHFLWGTLIILVCGVALAFTAIWNGWIGYMPPVEDLQNPINRFASQVYSSDGRVIGTYNLNKENRIIIPYSRISKHLVAGPGFSRWRFDHHSAACETIVFCAGAQYVGTNVTEAHRVGDSCET